MDPNEDPELREAEDKAIAEYLTNNPERWKAGMEEMGKFICTIGGMINLMAVLAAPRYLATANPEERPTPAQLLGVVDDYLVLLNGWASMPAESSRDTDSMRTEDATRRLRALLETWEWSLKAPEPIVEVARQWFAAYGQIPEPAGGWDQWTGPEDEDVKTRP